MPWDNVNQQGIPTRSSAVNDVITKCTKYEVRQEGVSSKASRVLEWEKLYSLLVLARHLYAAVDTCFFNCCALSSMANYRAH